MGKFKDKLYLKEDNLINSTGGFIDFYQFPNEENKGVRVFCKTGSGNYQFIKNAYNNHCLAYRYGLSVPKPYGLVRVGLENEKSYLGMIVENKKTGITLDNLTKEENFEDIRELFIKSIIKANFLGFSCYDSQRFSNSMYVQEENKVYLLDLDFWKYRGKGFEIKDFLEEYKLRKSLGLK